MDRVQSLVGATLVAFLVGCGGGGGGGGSPSPGGPTTPTPPTPAPASVRLAVTQPDIEQVLDWPAISAAAAGGTWSATNLGTEQVYLQLRDSLDRVAAVTVQAPSNGQWRFELAPAEDVPDGATTGQLTIRACKDAQCATEWAGASVSLAYKLDTRRSAGWLTAQKGASHDGFVPITLDPARFTERWTWAFDGTIEQGARIHAAVGAAGNVIVGTDIHAGNNYLFALDEQTGTRKWQVPFVGRFPANNPPAVANGKIYMQVTGQTDTFLWALRASDGSVVFKSAFESQWGHTLAPTPFGDAVYINGGFNGGSVYAFDALLGTKRWEATVPYRDMTTPAVDANGAYFHSGSGVEQWKLADGSNVGTIADPFADGMTTMNSAYRAAPVISGGRLFAYSTGVPGGAGFGSGYELEPPYYQRVLSGFDLTTRTYRWTTENLYANQPAAAHGLVFIGRSMPASLDALDAATGDIVWSWTPTSEQGNSFFRNVVVTNNLVFASTDKAIFAIDLATRAVAWSYPKPGAISIIADRTLLITEGGKETTGRVIAIGLK